MISICPSKKLTALKIYNAIFIDMSFHSRTGHSYLSPYFPWGDIPIPFSIDVKANSVMAIWEGLKVYESRGIHKNIFSAEDLKEKNQRNHDFGELIGYQRGISYDYIYSEEEAYQRIFIPSYRWVLEHKAYQMVYWLRNNIKRNIILVDNPKETINHQLTPAELLKAYVIGLWPYKDVIQREFKHHCYCGRRVYCWQTIEYSFKALPPQDELPYSGIFEFDF